MGSNVPKSFPQRIDSLQLARNNQVPDARFINQIGNAQNFINAYSKKLVACFDKANYTGGAGPDTIWRGYFHSGHATRAIKFVYTLAPGNGSGPNPANDPYITLSVTKVGGSTATVDHHWGANGTAGTSDVPNKQNVGRQTFAIDADADYSWFLSATGRAMPRTLTAFELGFDKLDNTVNYMLAPSYGYSEIYDASRQTIAQGLSQIWKHNGSPLVNWSRNGATSPTFTTTTWTNVNDSTTAVATTSAGYRLGGGLLTPYCRQSASTVNVVMAVYAGCTGATGSVRFQTDAGTTFASVTNIGAPAWYVLAQTAGATPTGFTKMDMQAQTSTSIGFPVLSVEAVSLYLYDA